MADKFACKKCGIETEGVEVRTLLNSSISPYCRECYMVESEKARKKNLRDIWIVIAIIIGISLAFPLILFLFG